MASQPIYQIYAELEGYTPKIFRRFQVLNNVTMARLSYILMTLFEMKAYHLYGFEVNMKLNAIKRDPTIAELYSEDSSDKWLYRFGIIDPENDSEFYDEDSDTWSVYRSLLKHAVCVEGDEMMFTYDFGDGWNIKLTLEKVFEDKELDGRLLPRLLEGKGYGIIEDSGGVYGLEDIRKAFKNKKGEDYDMYCNWLGVEELDLDNCDISDLDFRLKKVPRIYRDIYEYELEPTKQSLKILERDYLKKKS